MAPVSARFADLPDILLSDVASYLPSPSRAMFAAAVSSPASSWRERRWQGEPSAAAKAIVSLPSGDVWSVLDFGAVEQSLTERLTDDEVGAILACIGAGSNLKARV